MCPETLVKPVLLSIAVSSVCGLILGLILGRNLPRKEKTDDAPPRR